MSQPKFNGQIQLTSATPSEGSWLVDMTYNDFSGAYTGTNAAVGDIIILDTTTYETGTYSRFVITQITAQTIDSISAVIQYHPSNDNATGEPDISFSLGLSGLIARASALKDMSALPSPGLQNLSDVFAFYTYNDDLFNTIDKITGETNLAATADGVQVTIASDTGTDAVILGATGTTAGVMSATDKAKLDDIVVADIGTVKSVTVTSESDGIVVTGTAVTTSGEFQISLAGDLAAIEALSTTGIVKRSDAATWITGSIDLGSEVVGILPQSAVENLATSFSAKQNILTQGTNITIVGDVIAAAGADLGIVPSNTSVQITSSTGTAGTIVGATATEAGVLTAADKVKLDGIEAGANAYVLPIADGVNLGGVKVGTGLTIDAAGVVSTTVVGLTDGDKGDVTVSGSGSTWVVDAGTITNAKLADVSANTIKGRSTAGTGSPEDLTPTQVRALINVADGATANQTDAFLLDRTNHTGTQEISTVTGLQTALDSKQAALIPGNLITIVDATISATATDVTSTQLSTTVTLNSSTGTGTTIVGATATEAGVLTAADKVKLDGIEAGANAYVLPAATDLVLGGVKVGTGLAVGGDGTISATAIGLSDGDKGDITVSTSGTTWSIDSGVVSNAKLATVSTNTLKGRISADTGAPEDLTPTQVRALINVADGATANQTDAFLLDRANHTGTQSWSTIIDTPTTADGYNITDVVLTVQVGAPNGVASLDATGKLPISQLPATAVTDTYVVGSQTEMLALTAEVGDVAVRTDLNKSYILRGSSASTLTDWQELLTPTDTVLSVNGQTGIVSIDTVAHSTDSTTVTGGSAGQVLYQSAPGTTQFTATGTAGYLLQSNGSAAPTWVPAPSGETNLAIGTVSSSTVEVTSSTGTAAILPTATSTTAGVLASSDKSKLDAYPAVPRSFVQTRKTVVSNSITGYVQVVGFGTQSEIDALTVAQTGGNIVTVGNVTGGLQLQAISVSYDAGFNTTTSFTVQFPDVFGTDSTMATLLFPMMFHFNGATPSVIQATSAINYSVSGATVQMQKTGLATNSAARWRVVVI